MRKNARISGFLIIDLKEKKHRYGGVVHIVIGKTENKLKNSTNKTKIMPEK